MTADRDEEFSRYVTERSGALLRIAYLLTGNRADHWTEDPNARQQDPERTSFG